MSSVSKGPANEEFEPFDLSKMTAREVAAELVRRSHPPIPVPSEGIGPDVTLSDATLSDAPDAMSPPDEPSSDAMQARARRPGPTGRQEIVEPLPAFLRDAEELVRSRDVDLDWPPESAEAGIRDPLDVLSRALHTHLQERQLQQRATAEEKRVEEKRSRADHPSEVAASSVSPNPAWATGYSEPPISSVGYTDRSPLIPSSVMTTGPAMEADTSFPAAARVADSLDIPVQPSSIGRSADSALPASLSPGGFTRASTSPTSDPHAEASDRADDRGGEMAPRPAIRRIRASDRALERAKLAARLWLASASAHASIYAARLHLGRKGGSAVAEAAVIDDSDPIVPGSMISQSLVPDKASEPRKPSVFRQARVFGQARVAASRLAAACRSRSRIEWRAVHWEAVAGGMLLGIALTIGPAIYFVMAPGHAPALTVIAPAAQLSATEPSPAASPTGTAENDAAATDTPAASASQPAVAPPAIVPPEPAMPDPAALATAAGATSENGAAASNTAADSASGSNLPAGSASTAAVTTTSVTPTSAAATSTTASAGKTQLKPISQKASVKKVRPKAGTVSAHQATKAEIQQLSPAKR